MKLDYNCIFKYDNFTTFTPHFKDLISQINNYSNFYDTFTCETEHDNGKNLLKVNLNHKSQYFGVTSLLNETVLLFPIKIPPLSPGWTTFQQG